MAENLHPNNQKTLVFNTGDPALKIGELERYHSPFQTEKENPVSVQIYALNATPSLISLSAHNHILIENLGANTVQYSESSGGLFVDFIETGKAYALDFHRQTSFWLVTVAAGTTVRIVTW